MSTMLPPLPRVMPTIADDVSAACARIAPTWPLDRFIAVNPLWSHVDRPVQSAVADLAAESRATLLMPRSWYHEKIRSGDVRREHLERAIRSAKASCSVDELIALATRERTPVTALPTIADIADTKRRRNEPQPWSELVVHQISQHAAAWFDRAQSSWSMPRNGGGLFAAWREALAVDRGLPVRGSHLAFGLHVMELPADPMSCLEAVTRRLDLDSAQRRAWFAALLGSVRGWASWCAYERWQARLVDRDDDAIVHLLAIRGAWESLLVDELSLQGELPSWRERLGRHRDAARRIESETAYDWLLQHAVEIAFQQPLCAGLRGSPIGSDARRTLPAVQAVFCIDVRSERFRRALEGAGADGVRTRGFAGFFGMPIDYTPLGAEGARPQLPGLLAPKLRTTQSLVVSPHEGAEAQLVRRRRASLAWRRRWRDFKNAAGSAFTFVESCGLAHGFGLLRNSIGRAPVAERAEDAGLGAADLERLVPRWDPDRAPSADEQVALAAGVLLAMGLTENFARLVLLAGHGSSSANNPHAKGLDCGACGGQTGETNARLLARLLNDDTIRRGLAVNAITIPATTRFVAGLHDTTTDDMTLFDVATLPTSHHADLERLRAWLTVAGDRARAERAPSLGLADHAHDARALATALRHRARDWAQVRPEWGLADNAAFVVAPRTRTQHLDLGGRVFLHDYDWRSDAAFATLTLILTAPMVVTHWINFQYYASTVDNRRFGSGTKVLHNVVGGTIGVFEGNGGDLRIGLPMQSLHDGHDWRHTPRRLSVFVEAPAAAIDDVIANHSVVRQLVENGWLFLFRIDDDGATWQRTANGAWESTAP